jgi:hypothetical protein
MKCSLEGFWIIFFGHLPIYLYSNDRRQTHTNRLLYPLLRMRARGINISHRHDRYLYGMSVWAYILQFDLPIQILNMESDEICTQLFASHRHCVAAAGCRVLQRCIIYKYLVCCLLCALMAPLSALTAIGVMMTCNAWLSARVNNCLISASLGGFAVYRAVLSSQVSKSKGQLTDWLPIRS